MKMKSPNAPRFLFSAPFLSVQMKTNLSAFLSDKHRSLSQFLSVGNAPLKRERRYNLE